MILRILLGLFPQVTELFNHRRALSCLLNINAKLEAIISVPQLKAFTIIWLKEQMCFNFFILMTMMSRCFYTQTFTRVKFLSLSIFFLKFKLPGVIECTSYGLHFCCNGKLPYQYNLQFLAFTSQFRVSTVKALTLKAPHKCLRYLPP